RDYGVSRFPCQAARAPRCFPATRSREPCREPVTGRRPDGHLAPQLAGTWAMALQPLPVTCAAAGSPGPPAALPPDMAPKCQACDYSTKKMRCKSRRGTTDLGTTGRGAGHARAAGPGMSAVPELRRPLLEEGRHAFLLVLRGEQRMEEPPLEEHALAERRFVGPVDRLLDHHHRRQREARDRRGGLERLVEEALERHHAGDEPGALGLGRVHHPQIGR